MKTTMIITCPLGRGLGRIEELRCEDGYPVDLRSGRGKLGREDLEQGFRGSLYFSV